MKIPSKYQIFPKPVVLLDQDEERLTPLLAGWLKLHQVLCDTQERDLERLLVIEMMNRRRRHIIDRLAGRLTAISKIHIRRKIHHALR